MADLKETKTLPSLGLIKYATCLLCWDYRNMSLENYSDEDFTKKLLLIAHFQSSFSFPLFFLPFIFKSPFLPLFLKVYMETTPFKKRWGQVSVWEYAQGYSCELCNSRISKSKQVIARNQKICRVQPCEVQLYRYCMMLSFKMGLQVTVQYLYKNKYL